MKAETIFEALAHTPDEYLDSAQLAMEKGRLRRMGLRRSLLMAACIGLAVVMVAIPIASFVNWLNTYLCDPSVVTLDHETLEGMFYFNAYTMGDSTGTSNYQTVTVAAPEYLYVNTPPKSSYLPLYSIYDTQSEINQKEFNAFAQPRIQRLADAMNIRIDWTENFSFDGSLSVHFNGYSNDSSGGRIEITAEQTWESYTLYLLPSFDGLNTVTLDGKQIEICLSDSDEEIAKSMDGIREKFNAILDESFTDTMVQRSYQSISVSTPEQEPGIIYQVYFYNKDSIPFSEGMEYRPKYYGGDSLSISFEITPYDADATSTITAISSIWYNKNRTPSEERYKITGKMKMLSLKKAEELLRQGICFADGGKCMCGKDITPPPKDLTDYDYVGFVYRFSKDYQSGKANQSLAIPFYVFYKYRGEDENGLLCYDYTYVPAVEFEGMEKYFTS